MNDLIRRRAATEKTLQKYLGKPFIWGRTDCVKMLRSHLVAMGHRKLPSIPRYKDARSAKRALTKAGYSDLSAMLDDLLPRITPAAMLPGDVAVMQGEGFLDAVTVSVGTKVGGWNEGHDGFGIIAPFQIKAAWRA